MTRQPPEVIAINVFSHGEMPDSQRPGREALITANGIPGSMRIN